MDTHLARQVGSYFLSGHPHRPRLDPSQRPGSRALTTRCVAGIARRTGLPDHMVDDVVQDAVLMTIEVIDRLHSRGEPVRSWYGLLCRVATWRALSVIRAIHPAEALQDGRGDYRFDAESTVDVDDILLQRQVLDALVGIVAGATEAQREAVALYARANFESSKVDPAAVGKSMTALTTNMGAFRKRARKELIDQLGPEMLTTIG